VRKPITLLTVLIGISAVCVIVLGISERRRTLSESAQYRSDALAIVARVHRLSEREVDDIGSVSFNAELEAAHQATGALEEEYARDPFPPSQHLLDVAWLSLAAAEQLRVWRANDRFEWGASRRVDDEQMLHAHSQVADICASLVELLLSDASESEKQELSPAERGEMAGYVASCEAAIDALLETSDVDSMEGASGWDATPEPLLIAGRAVIDPIANVPPATPDAIPLRLRVALASRILSLGWYDRTAYGPSEAGDGCALWFATFTSAVLDAKSDLDRCKDRFDLRE